MLESLRGRLWAGMAVLITLVVLLFSLVAAKQAGALAG